MKLMRQSWIMKSSWTRLDNIIKQKQELEKEIIAQTTQNEQRINELENDKRIETESFTSSILEEWTCGSSTSMWIKRKRPTFDNVNSHDLQKNWNKELSQCKQLLQKVPPLHPISTNNYHTSILNFRRF